MARGVDAIPTARGVHVAHAHRLGIPARGRGNGHRWRPGLQISWLAVFVARFRGIVEGSCKPCESRDDVTGRLLMWRATAALLLAAATAADCPPPETVAAMVDAALSRPTGIGPQQCSEPVSLPFLAATYGFALVAGDAVASPRGVAVAVRACALAADRPPAPAACGGVGLAATVSSATARVAGAVAYDGACGWTATFAGAPANAPVETRAEGFVVRKTTKT